MGNISFLEGLQKPARQLHAEKLMKIICEKGYHAGNAASGGEYLEKRYPDDDMILDENMEITLSLKNGENGPSPSCSVKRNCSCHHTADHSEDYYNHDV